MADQLLLLARPSYTFETDYPDEVTVVDGVIYVDNVTGTDNTLFRITFTDYLGESTAGTATIDGASGTYTSNSGTKYMMLNTIENGGAWMAESTAPDPGDILNEIVGPETYEFTYAEDESNEVVYGSVACIMQGGTLTNATFALHMLIPGDTPPPGGTCFWTDLVNAEQICDGEEPEPEPTYAFESSSDLLDGGGGGLLIPEGWLDAGANLIDAAVTAEGYAKITAVYSLDMDELYSGITDLTLAYSTYMITGLKIYSWGAYDLTYGQTYIIDADFYDAGDSFLGSATGTMYVNEGV